MSIRWLQERNVTLGLSDKDNLHAKALLVAWCGVQTGTCPLTGYGTAPDDITSAWTMRDGIMLTAFSLWWNVSYGKSLPTGVAVGGIIQTDLTQAHLDALDQWAHSQGISAPSIQTPSTDCVTQCQNTYGVLDPVGLATCLAQCTGATPQTVPLPAPAQPPLPRAPPPIPAPTPAPTPSQAPQVPSVPAKEGTNVLTIALIAASVIGISVIAYQMGKSA